MPVKVTIRGGTETAKALSLLGSRASAAKILRQALRPGARDMANAAKQVAPVGTGALRKSIAIGIIGTRQHMARLVVGHRRDDPHARWRISHIIEFGSRFMAARPYMRPAAQGATAAITKFGAEIWPLILKEARRVAVRRASRGRRR
jgi:HK97 gp10 family phage protein